VSEIETDQRWRLLCESASEGARPRQIAEASSGNHQVSSSLERDLTLLILGFIDCAAREFPCALIPNLVLTRNRVNRKLPGIDLGESLPFATKSWAASPPPSLNSP